MSKLQRRRATLCSTLAIATALMVGASPAAAQALLGTVTNSTGVGTITNGPGSTVIPVIAPQAVINWGTTGPSTGGVTTFSNAGSTTSFTGQTNFAILNRVAPTVAGNSIFMGGNITSSVNEAVGGTVYFYSPNGIVIGSNAAINVGSLGLTTLPIDDIRGIWMNGFGTASPKVTFGAATNAASFVRTETSAGGALNANGPGNYIALVAPRVEHRGIIRTDSGAALVAAGAATITFNPSGFYDIVIPTGSSDANGVVVDGGRIERNSAAVGAPHRAYLVSVPANNAMTMLVQGGAQLGFDIAGSAAIEGNAVVLSAGRGSFGGPPAGAASVNVDHATIGSDLVIDATASARISSSGGLTTLSRDASVIAPVAISVIADNHPLSINGSLVGSTNNNVSGGAVTVRAQNGQTLAVGGTLSAAANGSGLNAAGDGSNAGNGSGGTVNIQATGGGSLLIGGGLDAQAGAFGGSHGFSNGAAGSATGGLINVDAIGGSKISVGGFAVLDARASGGSAIECTTCLIGGGAGSGGTINVTGTLRAANGGTNQIDFKGGLRMFADGTGGSGDAGAGAGRGGVLRLVTSDATVVTSRLGFSMAANGLGGSYLGTGVGAGGTGTGGQAQVGAYDNAGGSFDLFGFQGQVVLTAEGIGGDARGSGTGGNGQGGRIAIDAKGAAIMLGTDVFLNAAAEGGDALGGSGGSATGGSVFAHAFGSDFTLAGNLTLLATAFGGTGLSGGLGQGGTVSAAAETGSTLSVSGLASLDASALGGSGGVQSGQRGGRAQGGDATLVAGTGGSLALGSVFLTAFGFGGGGYEGGVAQGGHGAIASNLGNIDLSGDVFGFVSAIGGASDVANGGAATGGRFELVATGGTLDVAGTVSLETGAFGGGTFGALATGGSGTGGGLQVQARNGGTLTLGSALFAFSEGRGGEAFALTGRAGDGLGGAVNFGAIGTNATLDARGFVTLLADGVGGLAICGECTTGGTGGNGTGGQAFVQTSGGTGNRILTSNSVLISANGLGGGGYAGAGGNGLGGAASIFLADDARIVIGGGLGISARGDGGYQSNGGQAGSGTGGEALISLAGGATSLLSVGANGTIETDLTTVLDSSGYGGSAGVVAGGIGGSGTGGWSHIYGTGGSATFAGNVVIEAEGHGGNGENGAGGAGIGGRARLNADGAAYRLLADATLVTDARGGDGRNGGAASLRNVDNDNNSGVFANNGGSIVIDGAALVSADAHGGGGRNGGDGGSATAGRANVVANGSATGNGSITLSRVAITADASGGNGAAGGAGSAGGNGGNAAGGIAELATNNSVSGTNRVTVGSASLGALAQGGFGGLGGSGGTGARGGNGGNGTGGTALALSGAGNGAFTATDLSVFAYAFGGHGGDGGSGTTGVGGAGGTGGTGDGGVVVAGIASGLATPTTNSVFTVANLTGFADSYGGVGGDGGVGALGLGNGANGGDALLSFNQLLARGGTVSIGTARLTVDARGGNGGSGAVRGNGGTAYTPDVSVTATNRFNLPAAGATLAVGTLDSHANAYGGTGAVVGRAIAQGGPQLVVQNSSARFGSFSMVSVAGDGIDPGSFADPIRILNGTVSVDAGFRFETDHRMSVLIDNGALTAGAVTLDAASFERDTTVAPPTARGTIAAGTFALTSGGAMILDANLRSNGNLIVTVPGEIVIGDIAAATDVRLVAGTTIKLGAITSGLSTTIGAVGAVDVGNITANSFADVRSSGGSVTAGNVGARGPVALHAGTNLVAGTISGGDAVRLVSNGTTQVGSVVAEGLILGQSGGNLGSGALTGRSILLKSGAALNTANLTSTQAGIEVAAVGPLALGDVASAQSFQANAANLTLGTLRASGAATIDVAGNVTTGTVDAGAVDFAARGNIVVGTITVGGAIDLDAGGTLQARDATAGESIALAANGALIAGDLSAGLRDSAVRPGAGYNIGILSGTSVTVGNASARDWVGIGTRGALTIGSILSGNDVLLAADGAIRTGAIATGAQNRLLIAGADMVALGGPIATFDRSRLFAALGTSAEAATRGAVTIGGAVSTGRMDALVGGDFTTGALAATDSAVATVGGTMVINGAWSSALSRIRSNDVAIGTSGGIGGGRTDLLSRNATQLLVGDGLSGTGYAIDNAEFGRLSAGTVNIVGRSDASAAIDTLVGTLTLAGRNSGSSVTIATASDSASEPAGSLRVTGAISGTGFGANDALNLAAGRVEVDATTGGISLSGSGAQLGGALTLVGQRVHVAESAILDRLAADPNYAARDADLARAPVAQRPDGVVRAGEIVVKLVDTAGQTSTAVGTAAVSPYSVLVQNVGTSRIPAGFTAMATEIVSPAGAAPGSVDLNVNGQLVTPTGTLTGVAVRDALMADDDPARFTAASLINGCALVGPCGSAQLPFDPQPTLSAEIALLSTPPADDALFGNEEAIEDNEEEGGDDSASSPIAPPAPLFNTQPLEQKSDTDEPVSGGGNPALIGSGQVEGEK